MFLKAGDVEVRSGSSITLFLSVCFTQACCFKNNQVPSLGLENEMKLRSVFEEAEKGQKMPSPPYGELCSWMSSFLWMKKIPNPASAFC